MLSMEKPWSFWVAPLCLKTNPWRFSIDVQFLQPGCVLSDQVPHAKKPGLPHQVLRAISQVVQFLHLGLNFKGNSQLGPAKWDASEINKWTINWFINTVVYIITTYTLVNKVINQLSYGGPTLYRCSSFSHSNLANRSFCLRSPSKKKDIGPLFFEISRQKKRVGRLPFPSWIAGRWIFSSGQQSIVLSFAARQLTTNFTSKHVDSAENSDKNQHLVEWWRGHQSIANSVRFMIRPPHSHGLAPSDKIQAMTGPTSLRLGNVDG